MAKTRHVLIEYKERKRKIYAQLQEVDQWLLKNVKHPDFLSRAAERMKLLVDYDTTCAVIANAKLNKPSHGDSIDYQGLMNIITINQNGKIKK